jgi:hypothetical protein
MDLTGATVRWTSGAPGDRTWFTARVISAYDDEFGGYDGSVVDGGTFRIRVIAGEPRQLRSGELVFLSADHITVIDSEPDTQDPECE